ncbi:MAG: hypothetical protein N2504_06450 [candidate division WOR-3 bacterium]|nr:hypothetical protein [candidate division WOR-3 bacterium]
MKLEVKTIPNDLKNLLYQIPYREKKRKFLPISLGIITLATLLIYIKSAFFTYNKHFEYTGPKDGEVILPSEFSVISKEPIKVYINSELIEPRKENKYYIFEKELEEGEYILEIVKENTKHKIKFYVVDIG